MHSIKIISAMLILTIAIIGTGIYTLNTLDITSKKLVNNLLEIEDHIDSNSWDSAQKEMRSMEKDWVRTKKTWTMLLDHMEIDHIDITISRMTRFIETRDTPLALGEAATLKQYINHIPDKESFSLENIF